MEPRSAGFSIVGLRLCDASAEDPDLAAKLVEIIAAERIEAIFSSARRRSWRSSNRTRAALEASAAVPRARQFRRGDQDRARTKLETARFLRRHGFPCPRRRRPRTAAAVDALIRAVWLPGHRKSRVVDGDVRLNVFPRSNFARRNRWPPARSCPDLIVQQYTCLMPERSTRPGVVGSAAARTFAWIVASRDSDPGHDVSNRARAGSGDRVADRGDGRRRLGVEGACNFQFA